MYLIHREESQRNLQQLANSMPPCSPGDDGVNDGHCVSCEEEMAVGGVEVEQQQQQQRLLLPVDAPVFVPGAPVAAFRAADDGDDGDGDDGDDGGGGDGCSAAAAGGGGGDGDGRSAKVEASDMSR